MGTDGLPQITAGTVCPFPQVVIPLNDWMYLRVGDSIVYARCVNDDHARVCPSCRWGIIPDSLGGS